MAGSGADLQPGGKVAALRHSLPLNLAVKIAANV